MRDSEKICLAKLLNLTKYHNFSEEKFSLLLSDYAQFSVKKCVNKTCVALHFTHKVVSQLMIDRIKKNLMFNAIAKLTNFIDTYNYN